MKKTSQLHNRPPPFAGTCFLSPAFAAGPKAISWSTQIILDSPISHLVTEIFHTLWRRSCISTFSLQKNLSWFSSVVSWGRSSWEKMSLFCGLPNNDNWKKTFLKGWPSYIAGFPQLGGLWHRSHHSWHLWTTTISCSKAVCHHHHYHHDQQGRSPTARQPRGQWELLGRPQQLLQRRSQVMIVIWGTCKTFNFSNFKSSHILPIYPKVAVGYCKK